MKIPRFMIAAPKSGSGKTLLTCALLQLLHIQQYKVSAFKCGPDYIDPMFHKKVIGVPSHNLDSFFLEKKEVREVFCDACHEEMTQVAVLEGVMGLYDGLGGVSSKASCYEIACMTQTPIIMVVDAHGMGNSIVPLLSGFLKYDEMNLIKGVILNHVSKSYYQIVKPLIEEELKISVIGYYPYKENLKLESRHLGLKLPNEIQKLQENVNMAAEFARESISVEELLKIANAAESFEEYAPNRISHVYDSAPKVKIGVAMDEAFCFYYHENLKLLKTYGVQIVPFSPLHDKTVPNDISGLLLGGGYPELVAKELSQNVTMKKSIKDCIEKGMPSIAECGGFMYLHENLIDQEGKSFDMVGVIPANVRYQGRLVRFGYVDIMEKNPIFLAPGEGIKGHEFHYFDSNLNGEDCYAKKPVTQKTWECIHESDASFWGFPHLYYLSNPEFVRKFMEKARKFHQSSSCTLL